MAQIAQTAWARWQIIGEAFGDFQGRLFAVLFYFTVFVPFAVGVRLFSDPLHLRSKREQWLDREPVGISLESARRQF